MEQLLKVYNGYCKADLPQPRHVRSPSRCCSMTWAWSCKNLIQSSYPRELASTAVVSSIDAVGIGSLMRNASMSADRASPSRQKVTCIPPTAHVTGWHVVPAHSMSQSSVMNTAAATWPTQQQSPQLRQSVHTERCTTCPGHSHRKQQAFQAAGTLQAAWKRRTSGTMRRCWRMELTVLRRRESGAGGN